ncbi:dynein regulatory complex protein 10-like [Polypterus senegalus]
MDQPKNTHKHVSSRRHKHVTSILDETLKKTELLMLLLPFCLENLQQLRDILGEDFLKILQEHHRLEDRLKNLLKQKEGKERDPHVVKLKEAICQSLRNILRLFQVNPVTCKALKEKGALKGTAAIELGRGLTQLRSLLSEKRSRKPVEDEKNYYLEKMMLRREKNMKIVKDLEDQLALAVKNKDSEISMLDQDIWLVKRSSQHSQRKAEKLNMRTLVTAHRKVKAIHQVSNGKQIHLQQAVEQVKQQLVRLIDDNWDAEIILRKMNFRVEEEIKGLIEDKEDLLRRMHMDFEEINGFFIQERAEMDDLKQRFAVLEVEYKEALERQRLIMERKKALEHKLYLMTKAAVLIQFYWRRFRERRMAKRKKGGKKGKKGGKKGKGAKGKFNLLYEKLRHKVQYLLNMICLY